MNSYADIYAGDGKFHPSFVIGGLISLALSLRSATVEYDGKTYKRLAHRYNSTYSNSRSCEVPILMNLVKGYPPSRVLEIGNVLRHYYPVEHEVVDLYDEGADYMVDIAYWRPAGDRKYDLIISCSTMEHVGRDEADVAPGKCVAALHNVISMLAPGGLMVMTYGLGDNLELDEAVNRLTVRRAYMVGRDGLKNFRSWRQSYSCDARPGEKILCITYYRRDNRNGNQI